MRSRLVIKAVPPENHALVDDILRAFQQRSYLLDEEDEVPITELMELFESARSRFDAIGESYTDASIHNPHLTAVLSEQQEAFPAKSRRYVAALNAMVILMQMPASALHEVDRQLVRCVRVSSLAYGLLFHDVGVVTLRLRSDHTSVLKESTDTAVGVVAQALRQSNYGHPDGWVLRAMLLGRQGEESQENSYHVRLSRNRLDRLRSGLRLFFAHSPASLLLWTLSVGMFLATTPWFAGLVTDVFGSPGSVLQPSRADHTSAWLVGWFGRLGTTSLFTALVASLAALGEAAQCGTIPLEGLRVRHRWVAANEGRAGIALLV